VASCTLGSLPISVCLCAPVGNVGAGALDGPAVTPSQFAADIGEFVMGDGRGVVGTDPYNVYTQLPQNYRFDILKLAAQFLIL